MTIAAPEVTQGFGYSVGLSGDTAFLGSPFDDNIGSNTGAAYLFTVPEPTTGMLCLLGLVSYLPKRGRR